MSLLRLVGTLSLLLTAVLQGALLYLNTSAAHRVQFQKYLSSRATSQELLTHIAAPEQLGPAPTSLKLNPGAWLTYAEADAAAHGTRVSSSCESSHGAEFLQRFASARHTFCQPGQEDTLGPQHSSVKCFAYPLAKGGVACSAHNIAVNVSAFMGTGPKELQAHSGYIPAGGVGTVQLNCQLQATVGDLHSELLPWFTTAAAAPDRILTQQHERQCNLSVDHPVIFVTRLDSTNPYHHTQSVIQAFLTLAAVTASSSLQELQVITADHFTAGPFNSIWQQLSAPHTALSLNDASLLGRKVCFKHSIHAHYTEPSKAFLGYEGIGSEHTCPSTVLMAAAHWQRHLFKNVLPAAERREYEQLAAAHAYAVPRAAQQGTPAAAQMPPGHRRLNVVWLSRSWFSRSMKAGGGLTGWQAGRDMPADQEGAIVKALEETVLAWNNRACAPPVFGWWQELHAVPAQTGCKPTNVSFDFRFSELSVEDLYPDQLHLLTRTAVLVGVHGAALTNQIWMRPHKGAVVEFGAGGNFHFRNMAFELGHKHYRLDSNEMQAIADAVQQAMDHVSNRY